MLEVANIDLHYGAAQALRRVSLHAEPGKVTCMLGRNGVGKTSFLRAIVGEHPISNGSSVATVVHRALREDGPLSYEGKFVRFQGAELFPKAPELPIWYGGTSPRGLKRAARYTEGLIVGGPAVELRRLRDKVMRLRQEVGRGGAPFTMATLAMISIDRDAARAEAIAAKTLEERERAAWLRKQRRQYTERDAALVGTPAALRQRLQALADAGVDFVGLGFVGPSLQSVLDRMALFAEEVMPAFADPAARAAGALGGAS